MANDGYNFMVFAVRTLCVLIGIAACIEGTDLAAKYDALVAEMVNMKTEMEKLKAETRSLSTGSTYIRWGRSTCEGDAHVVYKGHAAGSTWSGSGSGSNYLCLHDSPQWMNYIPGFAWRGGVIYGLEYQIHADTNIFSTTHNGGHTLNGYPAACVACYLGSRSSVLVIPARTVCPAGWKLEYRGYISAEAQHVAHRRSQFICLDESPESATGAINTIVSLICPTQIGCGSLPCSRFIHGRELACVVCSK